MINTPAPSMTERKRFFSKKKCTEVTVLEFVKGAEHEMKGGRLLGAMETQEHQPPRYGLPDQRKGAHNRK